MEVDTSMQILDWVAICLARIKYLDEELDCEGPVVFCDDSVTLHCVRYHRDSRYFFLQCVIIEGKQVIDTWGLEIKIF